MQGGIVGKGKVEADVGFHLRQINRRDEQGDIAQEQLIAK